MRRAIAAALLTALAAAPAVAQAGPVPSELGAARAPIAQLELQRAITLPGGAIVYRYAQEVGGVPVLGAEAVALDLADGVSSLVADETRAAIERPPAPRLTRRRAIAIALEAAGVRRRRGTPAASLGIRPGDGGTLVWRVIAPSARPLADFEVLVDARSGIALTIRDRLWHSTGETQLFVPNPVVAQGGSYTGLHSDHGDRNTGRLTDRREHVVLRRIQSGRGCLKGKYAKALLGRDAEPVCKRSRNWNGAKRADDRFEALMTYHWIDRAQAYIQGLGFSDGNPLPQSGANDRRQVAVADAFRADNSFYSPGNRRIEFGEGGVDDAEDADVIVHEYGHAVQDDQVRFFGSSDEAGAMGEGFGDYLAATLTAEAPGTDEENAVCIFDWDGVSYSFDSPPCGRRADTKDTKNDRAPGPPSDPCGGEIHCWGEVWSSALWDLRVTLGDDGNGDSVLDRALVASHFMLTPGASFEDGAEALIGADEALYGAGDHCTEIRAEMVDREFLSGSFACPP
jgi:hypothetical protein